jgi:hypothetical protein
MALERILRNRAESMNEGPVFLLGDATHLFIPLGGLGMNTGIGDVMNLGWKLAAVYRGWAGPHLLAGYEIERRPVGERNSRLGVYCTHVMDQWMPPDNAEDDDEAAAKARADFGSHVMAEDRPQYLTVGIQLGERYENSPLICPDGAPRPPDHWDSYTPSDRPAPHFELARTSGLRRMRTRLHFVRFRRLRRRRFHHGELGVRGSATQSIPEGCALHRSGRTIPKEICPRAAR